MTSASHDAAIPAGGTTTVGFTGTFTSNDTAPSAFTLNGTPAADPGALYLSGRALLLVDRAHRVSG